MRSVDRSDRKHGAGYNRAADDHRWPSSPFGAIQVREDSSKGIQLVSLHLSVNGWLTIVHPTFSNPETPDARKDAFVLDRPAWVKRTGA